MCSAKVRVGALRVFRSLIDCAGPLLRGVRVQSDWWPLQCRSLVPSVSTQPLVRRGVRQPDMMGSTTIPHLIQLIPSAGYLVFWASLWIVHLMAIIYG